MERKTFGRVHIYVREGYNRAMKLADNGNHKEAIEILVPIVINNPAVPVLFEKLREYEMAYAKKASIGDKLLSFLLGTILAPVILVLTFINPEKAMGLCEKPLAAFVNNPLILTLRLQLRFYLYQSRLNGKRGPFFWQFRGRDRLRLPCSQCKCNRLGC